MEHQIKLDGEKLLCNMGKKVDFENSRDTEKEITILLADAKEVVFDMKNTIYASSIFLRIIMTAVRKVGKNNLTIINVNERVNKTLRISGFDKFLCILFNS
jgi:anti-anti-sigma factor